MRSGTEWDTPRRSALSVSSRNQRSTRLSQDEEVGVEVQVETGYTGREGKVMVPTGRPY